MAERLILLRHGDIGEPYHGRYIGSTDLPLTEMGRQQAEDLAELIRRENPGRCFCSPLRRCRETADVLSRAAGLNFETDPDLREIDFGQWEGMSFDEILAAFPEHVRRWNTFDLFTFPGGETVESFLARMRRAARRMAEDPADTVLACTHGGVIRNLICYFLGMQPRQYLLFAVKPASLTTIELFEGNGILTGLNETDRRNF